MSTLSKSVPALNATAMGDRKANLVLKNCRVVNVYTREIIHSDIAIRGDRIAYVGPDASHAISKNTRVVDLDGRYAAPGFADPHTHIDWFVLPGELAKRSLERGVTSLFSDPIDIVSVCGFSGFVDFVKMCAAAPIRIFNVVPGGLPVDPKFSLCKSISPSQEKTAIKRSDVLGLGEVFAWTKVTNRDRRTIKSITSMLEAGCVINGHTAGATDKKLNAYVASGILSCHEPINSDQVLQRLRLGMWVMMREGSTRRDLSSIIPQIINDNIPTDRLMFCTDGLDPSDIKEYGHIDHCVRAAIDLGMDPAEAIQAASRNSFDYYRMDHDLGGIAPGKLADIIILDDLKSIKPNMVFVGGKQVVSGGSMTGRIKRPRLPRYIRNTVRVRKINKNDFVTRSQRDRVSVNVIHMDTAIVTSGKVTEFAVDNHNVVLPEEGDIWKVAAFDRIYGSARRTVGFVERFGARIGAFASTWSFHENNLMVLGRNDEDMAIAANALMRSGGGMTVVSSGRILAHMPLDVAGIISSEPFDLVSDNFEQVTGTLSDAGCIFAKPHHVLLFLPFLALPSVRILAGGLVDVKNHSYMPVVRNIKIGTDGDLR